MSKNYQKPSPQTQDEALKMANATQRPGQTKEQTKLIAQGIQKGIELYKKQQKEKARELSKRHKKAAKEKAALAVEETPEVEEYIIDRQHWLPWLLLAVSWIGFGAFEWFFR